MKVNQNITRNINNENGFALLGTLLILVLLIVIGLISSTNTNLELQIAGNDRIHKETFYQADRGTQIGIRLVEESVGTGQFTALDADNRLIDPDNPNNTILIDDPDATIWNNENPARNQTTVSDISRDISYFPDGYNPALPDPNVSPHTNIIADGVTSLIEGSGGQMSAGYEGVGKGSSGLGSQILYSIYSQHIGKVQSESIVKVEWRHVIGLELDSRY